LEEATFFQVIIKPILRLLLKGSKSTFFYNEQRVHLETEEVPQKRWDEALKAGKGKFRLLDPTMNLDLIFSLHYQRTVKKDGTFSFQGREYKLRNLAGTRVTVGLIPGIKLLVIKDGQRAGEFPL
jgi:hypothetical protein